MQFTITGQDRDGALDKRMAVRPAHLEYIRSLGSAVLAAGPFLDDNGDPVGSMIVVEAESLEEAQAMAARDPYLVRGVFETSTVRRWNWIFGRPEGSGTGSGGE